MTTTTAPAARPVRGRRPPSGDSRLRRWRGSPPLTLLAVAAGVMMVGLDGPNTPIRRIDNGHLGWFWTRPDEPVIASRHPTTPPPGDWR